MKQVKKRIDEHLRRHDERILILENMSFNKEKVTMNEEIDYGFDMWRLLVVIT